MISQAVPGTLLVQIAFRVVAAPDADLWEGWPIHGQHSQASIDRAARGALLSEYGVKDEQGLNRVRDDAADAAAREPLSSCTQALCDLSISRYSHDEQLACWTNF